jgi:RNA polymerase sigma-70 factor (ECF subfamily)
VNTYAKDWDLSQEITQKTFVKLWEKRSEISFSTSSKSYLFQSARNALIDYYRAHKSATVHAEQYTGNFDEKEVAPIEEDEALMITHKIAWAVDQLKPKTKEIFLLNKQEGLTYDEIAEYLKISKRTVEYNMKNALLQLKELLKGKI